MINYMWEVVTDHRMKAGTTFSDKTFHVIAPTIIAACEKVNKIAEGEQQVIRSAIKNERIDT